MKINKKCGCCKKTKEIEEFSWRRKDKGQRQSWCKSCHKKIDKESYYKGNRKKQVRARDQKYRIHIKKIINRYKVFVGCYRCGYKKCAAALDLHHKNNKLNNIGTLAHGRIGIIKMRKEIRKCVVICANCHRELHYGSIV